MVGQPRPVEFDPFAGPALGSLCEPDAWQRLAAAWAQSLPDDAGGARAPVRIGARVACRFEAERLRQCVDAVVAEEPRLRTLFDASAAWSVVAAEPVFRFIAPGAKEAREETTLDCAKGPLFAVTLEGGKDESSSLSIEAHPYVCNELGAAGLLTRVLARYAGNSAHIPAGEDRAADDSHHAPVLRAMDRVANLPLCRPRPPDGAIDGPGHVRAALPAGTVDALRSLAAERGVPVGRVVIDAWALYLGILNANEPCDLVFAPFADDAGFQPNLLVARPIEVVPGDTLEAMLADQSTQAPEYLQPERPETAEVMSIQPAVVEPGRGVRYELTELQLRSLPPGSDLHVNLLSSASGDMLGATFAQDRVGGDMAAYRLGEFARVLAAVLDDRAIPCNAIDCLPACEREKILGHSVGAPLDVPRLTSSAEGFSLTAAARPDDIALRFDEDAMTYAALAGKVGACCRWLRAQGIEPEQRIAVMLPQSPEFIVVTLGLMHIGCTYVPLDRKAPQERLAYICKDAGIESVITDDPCEAFGERLPRRLVIALGDDGALPESVATDSPAYILYTSGSTGKPKGVVVSRHAMSCHNAAIVRNYGLREGDRVLQFANPVFDVAVEEIFPTLMAGGTVVLLPDQAQLSIAEFHRFLIQRELTVVNLPAGFWHEWVRYMAEQSLPLPPCLRLVIAGSDRVSREVFETWQRLAGSRAGFRNGYGPTETTVTATLFDPAGHAVRAETVPIGRPIANMQALVVRDGRVMPYGVRGELQLSGPQLADGYVGRADLDREVFVTHRASGEERRWYRTGDEVRLLPDGNLEFLGRIDHQVKVNGFRIELGEIERVLESLPEVTAVAAVVNRNAAGNVSLIAYYTTANGKAMAKEALAPAASKALPKYMLPARYHWLARMPMTPGGKIDRRALPVPESARPDLVNPMVAPGNTLERALAEIWSAELGIDEVGVLDNFFDLGGSSMTSLRVIEAINRRFSMTLSAARFFQYPTVNSLARHIADAGDPAPLSSGPSRGSRQRNAQSRFRGRRREHAT